MAEILKATTELLADSGPAGLTTRAVAERANVNHALIFRHFETKADLIRAALEAPIREMASYMAATRKKGAAAVLAISEDGAANARMLARVAIDPETPFDEDWQFPLVRAFLGDAAGDPERAAPAVLASALITGWVLFERPFTKAAELDENGKRYVHAVLQEHLEFLLGEGGTTIMRSNPRSAKRSRS